MASVAQTAQKRKRTAKACPNPLFEKWLEEWKKEAQERGMNSVHTYRKALNSLRQYPLPLRNGQEAKQLPNFGDTLARKLDKKMQEYNNALDVDSQDDETDANGVIPTVKESRLVPDLPPVTIRQEPISPVKKKRRINREYVPLPRSGGYAVLVALLKAEQSPGYSGYMLKKDLLKAAQPFCDVSFTIPEPGSHYTAWSSVSTLIKKQLVTKSGTVPAKYMLTEAGLELAQKLVHVNNSMNDSSPDDIEHRLPTSTVILQNSKKNSEAMPSGKNNLLLQEEVEDLESRLPKPWLLGQEDKCLTTSKISSISLKEKLALEKEVILSDSQPMHSEGTKSPINHNNISTSLPSSDSMLPGNSTVYNSVQSDELSPHFWYVDNEDNLVHEKNRAAILFDSDTFSTTFLVKATRKFLDTAGWLYTIDHSRPCGVSDVYAYINDLDAPELCPPPSNRVLPLPSHYVTTSLSSSGIPNNDLSIVTLSSDSEDELPSLSQRIGFTKTASGSSKDFSVNGDRTKQATGRGEKKQWDDEGLTVECRDEVPSESCSTGLPTVNKFSTCNNASGVMATIHNETVSMPMGHTNGQSVRTNSDCDIITIHDDDIPTTSASQQSQNSPIASNLTNKNQSSSVDDHSSCSRLTLKPSEYEVVLYIDNVEANNKSNLNGVLMAELTKNGINCKVCKLQVGDFLWVAKKSSSVAAGPPLELVLDHIIERKRMDDLSKSIIDRRFAEQKFRLTHCGIHHVIYLIEEYGDPGRFSIPASSLNQAITNTQVIDGFYIRRTQNIKDTVAYLTTMTRCLQRHYSGVTLEEHSVECVTSSDKMLPPALSSSGGVVKLMSFTTFSAATVKSKVMTVTEMFAKHLIQIPGFSAEKAEAVIAQFPTPTSLFKGYSQCSPPEKRPLLLELIKHGRRNSWLTETLKEIIIFRLWNMIDACISPTLVKHAAEVTYSAIVAHEAFESELFSDST